MNNGKYLEESLLDAEPTSFGIGISGYPEKHFEAPNLQTDINFTQEKIKVGAEYIVSQMFYDNKKYFNYLDLCRKSGIQVPILPELSEEIQAAKDEHVAEIGIEWAFKQAEELMNKNVPAIHFYVMQNTGPIKTLMKKLGR